jgi:PadR family transcriptional regulator AphA
MSLRHALLGMLAEHPDTGYALRKRFERSLANVWSAETSQIYPELARLERDGLITQSASGPRRSKIYSATPAGVSEVKRWLMDVEPNRSSRNELLLRVFFFFLLDAAEIRRLLRDEIEYHRELLARYEEIDKALKGSPRPGSRFGRIVLQWGLRYEPAFIEWLEWAATQASRAQKGLAGAERKRRASGLSARR